MVLWKGRFSAVLAVFVALGLCGVAVGTTSVALQPVLTPIPDRPSHSRRLSSDVQFNNRRAAYVASIKVGDQNLNVLFDTGSSDLWTASSNCSTASCSGSGVPKYTASPSLQVSSGSFDLGYMVGSVSGSIASETVTLGSYQIVAQTFGLVKDVQDMDLSQLGNSGVLGLAFPAAASVAVTAGQPILENLFSYFDDDQRYFAFRLGRAADDSSFTIGHLDEDIANSTESIVYTPVYSQRMPDYDYWKLPLHSITLNSTLNLTSDAHLSKSKISGSPTPIAVLDTGTTFILGPKDDVRLFWTTVGGARQNDAGNWEVQCNRAVSVGFVLGDDKTGSVKEYLVDPMDINQQTTNAGGWCTGGIQGSDFVNSGDWILGVAFLRVGVLQNVYAIHHGATSSDPPRIGLLNTTDSSASLEHFREVRGDDTNPALDPSAEVEPRYDGNRAHLNGLAILGIVITGSFVLGVVIYWIVQHCVPWLFF
ncbi:acid protease [Stereum hirsutum FP-91666 SS1]|uniref:acid protease n=1 Tax=Stereum hirsutum (strain FP-91666) TaxID=721885 RepID=UPI000440EC6D|nr:acid protease [Stereum hirsutum FP-91666 SS1]EIM90202.1 acid protease [Stereum hirsutum FP-91666 SS1]